MIVHETYWHHYGSLAYSRTGLSAFGPRVGLGATPLRSTDLQPRNPPLRSPIYSWFGVAPSPRLQRDGSLREGYSGLLAPPALRSSWNTSRTRPARLIIPITTALAALYLRLRYAVFPGPGDVPILDLIALVAPRAPPSSLPARNAAHCSMSSRLRSNRSVRR